MGVGALIRQDVEYVMNGTIFLGITYSRHSIRMCAGYMHVKKTYFYFALLLFISW